MKRTVTALAALSVLISTACSSSPSHAWAVPLNRTSCTQWNSEMSTRQREAAGHVLLAAVPTKDQSDDAAKALATYLTSQCKAFPTQMVEGLAGIRT